MISGLSARHVYPEHERSSSPLIHNAIRFGFSLYAEDDIELPDLTTVVSTDKDENENIPAPDFTDLIQLPETAGKLVPELPEVELKDGE